MPWTDPEAMVWSAQLRKRDRDQRARDALAAVYEHPARAAANDGVSRRTFERRGASKPTEAVEIWQSVITGRWSLLEHFDSEGHRCFLARQNDPDAPSTPPLSERERQIVVRASLGFSNKHIAYELGLCSSTVAAQLTNAARKLGVASRETLLHAFAVLGGASADDGASPDGSSLPVPHHPVPHHPVPHHDDDPTIQMVRFRHDEQEHAIIRIAIAPRLPSSLTAAEAAVAALVIEGLSNAAIATRRETSVRTVANQLRSIYSKLAVDSRRQLRSRFSIQRSLGQRSLGSGEILVDCSE